jgi:hypothetical protein
MITVSGVLMLSMLANAILVGRRLKRLEALEDTTRL